MTGQAAAYSGPGGVIEFHALVLHMPQETVRLITGGVAVIAGQVFESAHPTFGVIDSIGRIINGAVSQAGVCDVGLLPAGGQAVIDLSLARRARAEVLKGVIDGVSGEVSWWKRIFTGRVEHTPFMVSHDQWRVTLELATEELRQRRRDSAKRLSRAWHQSIWGSGERGLDNVTGVDRPIYWRADAPRGSGGGASGGGGGGTGGGGFNPIPIDIRIS